MCMSVGDDYKYEGEKATLNAHVLGYTGKEANTAVIQLTKTSTKTGKQTTSLLKGVHTALFELHVEGSKALRGFTEVKRPSSIKWSEGFPHEPIPGAKTKTVAAVVTEALNELQTA